MSEHITPHKPKKLKPTEGGPGIYVQKPRRSGFHPIKETTQSVPVSEAVTITIDGMEPTIGWQEVRSASGVYFLATEVKGGVVIKDLDDGAMTFIPKAKISGNKLI